MLEVNHRLPLQFSQQHQEKLFFEKLELLPETEKQGENQFVFHGQCMILGDSGVGKTSLVKSLTGKEFDPKQTKTQGIDQSLVDQKWKYHNMKELVFGDLWRFFTSGTVQVLLIGTGAETSNVVVAGFLLRKRSFQLTVFLWAVMVIGLLFISVMGNNDLFVGSFLFHLLSLVVQIAEIALFCGFYFFHNRLRFTLVAFSFIIRNRGLLIGAYLAPVICYWDETYVDFVSVRAILLLATIAGIALIVLFILIGPSLPFGNDHQHLHLYPGRLIHNHSCMMFFCFCRLLLSIFIGLIYGFVAALLASVSLKELYTVVLDERLTFTPTRLSDDDIVGFCVSPFLCLFPCACFELGLVKSLIISLSAEPLGPYIVLLAVIVFYHLKLTLTSGSFYFVIVFPLFICYTFYVELFCLHSIVPGNFECPNKLITLVTASEAEMDNEMLKSALNEKFSSLKLKILDFAGDQEYYAYHHMFLRRHAIYLIVFNMAEFVANDFKNMTAGIQRLQFWFESICSHVPPKAPIFLVGTHRGTIEKNYIETLDGHLRSNLWNSYCDELVVNDVDDMVFFPVENSNGQNDFGVKCLQNKIVDVAEHCKDTIGRDIPLSWVRIQDAIISLKEKKEAKFCVTLDEFPRAFEKFVCTNVSKETLMYFHEKGLIIYLDKHQELDLSNWVLLKPEILVDIIIQLVTPPFEITQQRGLRRDWNLLQKNGLLMKSLLRSIISKVQENEEAMTAFLEEYDLICPLGNKKVKMCSLRENDQQPIHFVPSLLPKFVDGDNSVWQDDATDKRCYVFFTRFLPEPLFHRLLSRAHKLSKLEFPNGHTVLFRNAGKFWMNARQPYHLKLMKEEKLIEVTFSCRKNHRMRPSDVLCQVFSMVDGICRRDFPFVDFHCGPACPSHKCPGHQHDYLSIYATGEEQGPRCHVYNVMPGRQGDRIASLYCGNDSFEEELDEWVP